MSRELMFTKDEIEKICEKAVAPDYIVTTKWTFHRMHRMVLLKDVRQQWYWFYRSYREYAAAKSALLYYKNNQATMWYYDDGALCTKTFCPLKIKRYNSNIRKQYPLRNEV